MVDLLAFAGPQMEPPIFSPECRLRLACLTAAPPMNGGLVTVAKTVAEIVSFESTLVSQLQVRVVRSANEIQADKLNALLTLQHAPSDMVHKEQFNQLVRDGIRVMSLAYQTNNRFGSGWLDPDGCLTKNGEELLGWMAESGMMLDVAHVGHQTIEDALDFIEGEGLEIGVCATHSGCHSVYPHLRNLPDHLLKRITEMGGVVGISTCTFLNHGSDNTLDPFVEHLRHAIRVCGTGAVAIGSDGVYQKQDLAALQAKFEEMKPKFDPDGKIGARFPDQPIELNRPDRMEILYRAMEGENLWSYETLWGVFGRNAVRFLTENLK